MAISKIIAEELKSDLKKIVDPGNVRQKVVGKVFEGDDIFARVGRKAFGGDKEKPAKKSDVEKVTKQISSDVSNLNTSLKAMVESSSVLPNMANDVSIIAQNMQQLVELSKPDADDFFRQEDMEEAQKEAENVEPIKVEAESGQPQQTKKGGFLGMLQSFGSAIKMAFAKLFDPKKIFKSVLKVFVIATLIVSLFKGIKDGFDRYRETNNLSDALFAGFGGMFEFLTFGLINEDSLKSIFNNLSKFFDPISKSIQSIFSGIKNFFGGLFGGNATSEDLTGDTEKNALGKFKEGPIPDVLKKTNLKDATTNILDNIDKPNLKTSQEQKLKETQDIVEPKKDVKVIKEVSKPVQTPKKTTPTKVTSEEKSKEYNPFESKSPTSTGRYEGQGIVEEFETEDKKRGKGRRYTTDDGKLVAPLELLDGQARIDALAEMGLDSQGREISDKPLNKGPSNFRKAIANAKKKKKAESVNVDNSSSSLEDIKPGVMTSPQKSTSGNSLSEKSSNIAEGQRMESAADQGDMVNNSSVNNVNNSSTSNRKTKVGSTYNSDMLSLQGT